MRLVVAGILALSQTPALAAPMTPRGISIPIACTGPVALAARKTAAANGIKWAMQPSACYGQMKIYDGPDIQYVAVAPSTACPRGKALDVFGKSRAGSWYSYFEKPVCGTTVVIGPKNQWGDWMLTVDGKHYDSRGAFYVPVP